MLGFLRSSWHTLQLQLPLLCITTPTFLVMAVQYHVRWVNSISFGTSPGGKFAM